MAYEKETIDNDKKRLDDFYNSLSENVTVRRSKYNDENILEHLNSQLTVDEFFSKNTHLKRTEFADERYMEFLSEMNDKQMNYLNDMYEKFGELSNFSERFKNDVEEAKKFIDSYNSSTPEELVVVSADVIEDEPSKLNEFKNTLKEDYKAKLESVVENENLKEEFVTFKENLPEKKELSYEELIKLVSELSSKVEILEQQVTVNKNVEKDISLDVDVEKADAKKERKINFSKVGEFKDSQLKKANALIESKKEQFVSSIDKKKQIVQAYSEIAKNNKYVARAKGTKAVFDKHIKAPVSDKATIKTLNGLEKVGEFQSKIAGKFKQLEEAISLKTESIMAQNGLDPKDKKVKYETFFKASLELGKETASNKFKETKLGQQIEKMSNLFKEKSKAIQETYKEKSNDVTMKQQSAKEKINNLSTNM